MSIFRVVIGRTDKDERDEYPVPKSSIKQLIPNLIHKAWQAVQSWTNEEMGLGHNTVLILLTLNIIIEIDVTVGGAFQ